MNGVVWGMLFLLGAVGGSFAGAQVWRLRLKQLREDKALGEAVDEHELKRLSKLAAVHQRDDRSKCLHCGYCLEWYDMLPVVSWLALGGKCRRCKAPIGRVELALEIGLGLFFVFSYLYWPHLLDLFVAQLQFSLWCIISVILAILIVYDARWFILPNRLNWLFVGSGFMYVLLTVSQYNDWTHAVVETLGAVAVLSGIYFVLFVISRGAWIGFGDIKLGLGLGLVLGNWTHAFLALFLANLIGCIVVLPGLLTKKIKRTSHVPFGPFLIAGMILAFFFGETIIQWYLMWGMSWFSVITLMV